MRCALAVVVVVLAVSASDAREPSAVARRPIVLRLQGAFAPDRERAAMQGADAVDMRIGSRDRWFSATTVRTVGGDTTLSGKDVLAQLAPIRPNLRIVGDAALRRALEEAADDTPLTVEGLVDRGAHMLLLRAVAFDDSGRP